MVQLVVAREYHEGVTRCSSIVGNGRKWRKAQAWRCAEYKGEGDGGRDPGPASIRKRHVRNSLRERGQPRGRVQCGRRKRAWPRRGAARSDSQALKHHEQGPCAIRHI